MASTISIYHNPRCSKSRQTLALLAERGITPNIILYLKTPPQPEQLTDLLNKLDMAPRELLRTKETEFKELGLSDSQLSDSSIIEAMANHPKLIERPIVVSGDQAAIGRPPENVLKIL